MPQPRYGQDSVSKTYHERGVTSWDVCFAALVCHPASDEQMWIKLVAGDLVLLSSAHFDNRKGCGTPKEREAFLEHLRARFGKR